MLDQCQPSESTTENRLVPIAVDREVVSCRICTLVQYRTRTGKCRRCERLLPPQVVVAPPESKPRPEMEVVNRRSETRTVPLTRWRGAGKLLNLEMVEGIGRRIQQFRELRGLTQNGLQELSRVSRSYLSRIEIGQMTPSLGTLEKISEALGISLNRFFAPLPNHNDVLEDPFIQELRPLLKAFDFDQRQMVLQRIATMSANTANGATEPITLPEPKPIRINGTPNAAVFGAAASAEVQQRRA